MTAVPAFFVLAVEDYLTNLTDEEFADLTARTRPPGDANPASLAASIPRN